jgi:hypothetical protein
MGKHRTGRGLRASILFKVFSGLPEVAVAGNRTRASARSHRNLLDLIPISAILRVARVHPLPQPVPLPLYRSWTCGPGAGVFLTLIRLPPIRKGNLDDPLDLVSS